MLRRIKRFFLALFGKLETEEQSISEEKSEEVKLKPEEAEEEIKAEEKEEVREKIFISEAEIREKGSFCEICGSKVFENEEVCSCCGGKLK